MVVWDIAEFKFQLSIESTFGGFFYFISFSESYITFHRLHSVLLLLCMLGCFSCVRLFVTLWTVARQAPLSIEFSRQEYWSGLPFAQRRSGFLESSGKATLVLGQGPGGRQEGGALGWVVQGGDQVRRGQ